MRDARENECWNCGDTERVKASATKVFGKWTVTRYFCHTAARSCYNERRGRYFEDLEAR